MWRALAAAAPTAADVRNSRRDRRARPGGVRGAEDGGGLRPPPGLGQFLGDQLTGGMPGSTGITIDQETASLEHLLAADPPPPPHRVIIAGIRLAEIYRTHQRDVPKADALIARLAAQYPDAPELRYLRPPAPR